nr:retrovirus-related Pol polyprotein from transposon TNT 1-94 [Tanacetum cinerariifolium]
MLLVQGEILQVDMQELLNATTANVKDIWIGNALSLSDQGMQHDSRIPASQAQTIIPHNATFQIEDLDTYDSDCDDLSISEEESRSKISKKEKDPKAVKQNISHKPIDYEKLNRLTEDSGKRFTPQQELLAEQAFWLRNCSQLMNFVSKFLGTIRFKNDQIARIMGYGDYQLGNVISRLAKDGLARGIPRLKFQKDHLCSTCSLGKSKKSSHQPKAKDTNQEELYLLHMDLCGPMHMASINGKRYILVIVDDYSRFTWPVDLTLAMLSAYVPDMSLTTYADADHAGCHDTRRSTSESAQFLADKLVSWLSKKQKNYGFPFNKVPLYYDNKSAIALRCNNVQHSRSKHIDVRYHFIKKHMENGIVELYFVRTEYQLADIFTKPLPQDRFNFLIDKLGMKSMSPDTLKHLAEESDE